MDTSASRRPFFSEGNSGLASIAGIEAGFSVYNHPSLISRSMCSPRRSGGSVSSPRSGRFYDARFEEHQPHFLESCFLCKKPLGNNRDIFMYRGDTPFCSEECRNEQIERDETKEKGKNLSSSMKAMRKKEQNKSTSPSKGQSYSFRTGTVAAA